MLRYLENGEELNVSITELQEQLEVPVQIGITLQQVTQQARNERNPQVFMKSFGKSAVERLGGVVRTQVGNYRC